MPSNYDLSFFDAFEAALSGTAAANVSMFTPRANKVASSAKEAPAEDVVSDYLMQGERLETMTRERYERETAAFTFSKFHEALYDPKRKKTNDVVREIANSVIRPILRKAADENDAMLCELLSEINGVGKWAVSIQYIERNDVGVKGLRYYMRGFQPEEKVLQIEIKEDGFPVLVAFSRSREAESKSRRNLLFKSGHCWVDAAYLLSHLLIVSVAVKEIERIKSLAAGELGEDVVAVKLKKHHDELLLKLRSGLELHQGDFSFVQLPEGVNPIYDCFWLDCPTYVVEEIAPVCLKKYFKANLRDPKNFIVVRDALQARSFRKANGGIVLSKLGSNTDLLDLLLAEIVEDFCYHDLLFENKKTLQFWAVPHLMSAFSVFKRIFEVYLDIECGKVRTYQYMREVSGQYAKSFMRKKNIPEKLLKEMEISSFNNHFGYVEFDESVDLEKAKVICKQFVAFKERFFMGLDITDNVIRFRKLGNHKAVGLYYPFQKCLCVDVRCPSSLIHEFGHLVDNQLGSWLHQLSSKADFLAVRERYAFLLKAKSSMLNLKGKYNLNYYLEPTEIFARSFELYMRYVQGIDCSLLPEEFGEVYPYEDEIYMKAVTEYFDRLLERFKVAEAA